MFIDGGNEIAAGVIPANLSCLSAVLVDQNIIGTQVSLGHTFEERDRNTLHCLQRDPSRLQDVLASNAENSAAISGYSTRRSRTTLQRVDQAFQRFVSTMS